MCREPPITPGGQPAPPTQNTPTPPIRLGEREGPAPRKEKETSPIHHPKRREPRLPAVANPRPPHRTRRPRQFASGSARGRPLAKKGNETHPPPRTAGSAAYPRRPTRAPHTEHADPASSPRGARGAGPSQRKERDPSTTPSGGKRRLPAAANPRLPHRTRRPRQFASGSARGRPLAKKGNETHPPPRAAGTPAYPRRPTRAPHTEHAGPANSPRGARGAGPSQEKSDRPHLPHNVRMPPTRPQPRGIASCN